MSYVESRQLRRIVGQLGGVYRADGHGSVPYATQRKVEDAIIDLIITRYQSGDWRSPLKNSAPTTGKKMSARKNTTANPFRLSPADRKVLGAFIDHKAAASKKVESTGSVLRLAGFLASKVAMWEGRKVTLLDLDSRSAQTVQKALVRMAPTNIIKQASTSASKRVRKTRSNPAEDWHHEILRGAAESEEVEFEGLEVTPKLRALWDRFDAAVDATLEKWLRTNRLDEDKLYDMQNEDSAYNVYMTITGEGVGVWDGRWDHIITDAQAKSLTEYLTRELRAYGDDTGDGLIPNAMHDAIYAQTQDNPRHPKVKMNAKKIPDIHGARELLLYAENEGRGQVYRQRQSIEENLRKKAAKGKYNHALAPKWWGYWMDTAAKAYVKDSGDSTKWYTMFDKPTREAAAKDMADQFLEELRYDGLVKNPTKKKATKKKATKKKTAKKKVTKKRATKKKVTKKKVTKKKVTKKKVTKKKVTKKKVTKKKVTKASRSRAAKKGAKTRAKKKAVCSRAGSNLRTRRMSLAGRRLVACHKNPAVSQMTAAQLIRLASQ